MTDASTGNATPAAPAPASEAPAKKPIAPIPPKTAAPAAPPAAPPVQKGAEPEKHEDRQRDDKGRFTAEEALEHAALVDDPDDYPKTTLDGMASEELDAPRPKITRKQRAKDMFSPLLGEGSDEAPALDEAAAPGGEPKEAGARNPDPAAPQPEDQPTPPAAEKFVFAGHEWDSAAQAEQEFRTYRGRYLKTREIEANAQTAAAERDEWKRKYAEAVAGKSSDPKPGEPANVPANGAAASPENGDEPLNGINWDTYKIIQEKHGDAAANLWATEEALKAMQKKFDTRLEELTRPSKEHAELQQHAFQAGETMNKMAEEYPGQFPEFEDDDALSEMGQFFRTRNEGGVPWAYLKSPRGVYETVLAHRAWRSEIGRPMGSPQPVAPPKPNAVAQAVESVRQANPTLSGRSAPVRTAPANEAQGSKVKRAILGSQVSSEFGWSE